MSKVIPTIERIKKARLLIQKARDLPLPPDQGWGDLSYTANVKDILRQARDLVKFVQFNPGVTMDEKREVQNLMGEISLAEKQILHRS